MGRSGKEAVPMVKVMVDEGCVGGLAGMRVRIKSPEDNGSGADEGVGMCRAVQDCISSKVVMVIEWYIDRSLRCEDEVTLATWK
jgi:hypothetical protein